MTFRHQTPAQSTHAKPPFWSTSGSAQIKTVTVPDLDVLHAYEALSQAHDLAELCGRRVWRPGSTATPMIGILVRSQWRGRQAERPCCGSSPGRLRFHTRFVLGSSSWGISHCCRDVWCRRGG